MSKEDFTAFTLAEVLITLGIIGVVAAMTLPTLIQKQNDRANITRLKKVYSSLSQAYLMVKEEHGSSEIWDIRDGNQASTRTIFSYFEPYFRIVKKCDNVAGCWSDSTKSLSGQAAHWSGVNYLGYGYYGFILEDGTYLSLDLCLTQYAYFGLPYNSNEMNTQFVLFFVDVNGNKNPNTVGKDVFGFAVGKEKIIPFGAGNNSANCNRSVNNYVAGYDCAYKVLIEDKISY